MARINTNQLIQHATSYADRVDQVQRDPMVRKAWMDAAADAASAVASVKTAAQETRAAWYRTDAARTAARTTATTGTDLTGVRAA